MPRLTQVDAFTAEPFSGNPAAVCILPTFPPDDWMQAVAAEMNLSETAFLVADGDVWQLRWFTPAVEVRLCGHATLAAAHVLWEEGRLEREAVARFRTWSGELRATCRGEWIVMDFPADPAEDRAAPPGLGQALGLTVETIAVGAEYGLVTVENEQVLREIRPEYQALARVHPGGLIVTSAGATSEWDFLSRFFAPAYGIDEDPVTGSAHCMLAPFWERKLGKSEMVAYQASPRGGVVRVRVLGDRVELEGQAVTVMRAELL